jgi:nucleoid-associated protein YgaU
MAEMSRKFGGFAALGLLALCAIGGLVYLGTRPELQPTPAAPPPPAAVTAAPPVFDVLRVDPQGNAVLAGRAAPGAVVTAKSGASIVGSTTADSQGAFVILPDTPLPPGAQEITLSETLPDGTIIPGQSTASIDVPGNASAPLAVLSGPTGSTVMSGQGPKAGTLAMGTVDYDANGHAVFSGTAPANAQVSLSLGNQVLGRVMSDANGRWKFTANVPATSGTLSLSATNAAGALLPTVTAPFALETLPDALAAGHVVITPGDNLWLIARHVYGHGNLYTLIYTANASQIHDPNLIFPGQAFALPKPQG